MIEVIKVNVEISELCFIHCFLMMNYHLVALILHTLLFAYFLISLCVIFQK